MKDKIRVPRVRVKTVFHAGIKWYPNFVSKLTTSGTHMCLYSSQNILWSTSVFFLVLKDAPPHEY